MSAITSIDELETIYGFPAETATVKEVSRIIPEYRAYIEAAPFAVLSTCGPEGFGQFAAWRPTGVCANSRRHDLNAPRPPGGTTASIHSAILYATRVWRCCS